MESSNLSFVMLIIPILGLILALATVVARTAPVSPAALSRVQHGALEGPTGTRRIDGIRLRYWIEGLGSDHGELDAGGARGPVVVLHGGPGLGSGYLREPISRLLGARLPLLFFDQRGSGRSEGVDEPGDLTMARLVRDIEALREQAELDRIRLLGHSFGGLLALHYAAAYPQRVERLVLVDSDPATYAQWASFTAVLRRRTEPEDAARMAAIADVPGWDESPAAYQEWYALRLRAFAARAEAVAGLPLRFDEATLRNQRVTPAAVRRDLGEWDIREQLGRIRTPTLVVAGGDSVFPVSAAVDLRARIPTAELVVLEGVGHFPFVEAPERFAAAVIEFLQR